MKLLLTVLRDLFHFPVILVLVLIRFVRFVRLVDFINCVNTVTPSTVCTMRQYIGQERHNVMTPALHCHAVDFR